MSTTTDFGGPLTTDEWKTVYGKFCKDTHTIHDPSRLEEFKTQLMMGIMQVPNVTDRIAKLLDLMVRAERFTLEDIERMADGRKKSTDEAQRSEDLPKETPEGSS